MGDSRQQRILRAADAGSLEWACGSRAQLEAADGAGGAGADPRDSSHAAVSGDRAEPGEETGLRRVSQGMVDKATTVPRGKIGARVDAATMQAVSKAVIGFLRV